MRRRRRSFKSLFLDTTSEKDLTFTTHPIFGIFVNKRLEDQFLDQYYGKTIAWRLAIPTFITTWLMFMFVYFDLTYFIDWGQIEWLIGTLAIFVLCWLTFFCSLFPYIVKRRILLESVYSFSLITIGMYFSFHDIEMDGHNFYPIKVSVGYFILGSVVLLRLRTFVVLFYTIIIFLLYVVIYFLTLYHNFLIGDFSLLKDLRIVVSYLSIFLILVITVSIVRMMNIMDRSMFINMFKLKEKQKVMIKQFKKTTYLLLNILPSDLLGDLRVSKLRNCRIYKQLKHGSCLEADLVDFSAWSTQKSNFILFDLLNKYIQFFDLICEGLGLEKFKTIGDSFIAFGKDEKSYNNVVLLGLGIIDGVKIINSRNKENLSIRVGIASGEMILTVFTNDVSGASSSTITTEMFGKLVGESEKLENTTLPNCVNVCNEIYESTKETFSYSNEKDGKHLIKLNEIKKTYHFVCTDSELIKLMDQKMFHASGGKDISKLFKEEKHESVDELISETSDECESELSIKTSSKIFQKKNVHEPRISGYTSNTRSLSSKSSSYNNETSKISSDLMPIKEKKHFFSRVVERIKNCKFISPEGYVYTLLTFNSFNKEWNVYLQNFYESTSNVSFSFIFLLQFCYNIILIVHIICMEGISFEWNSIKEIDENGFETILHPPGTIFGMKINVYFTPHFYSLYAISIYIAVIVEISSFFLILFLHLIFKIKNIYLNYVASLLNHLLIRLPYIFLIFEDFSRRFKGDLFMFFPMMFVMFFSTDSILHIFLQFGLLLLDVLLLIVKYIFYAYDFNESELIGDLMFFTFGAGISILTIIIKEISLKNSHLSKLRTKEGTMKIKLVQRKNNNLIYSVLPKEIVQRLFENDFKSFSFSNNCFVCFIKLTGIKEIIENFNDLDKSKDNESFKEGIDKVVNFLSIIFGDFDEVVEKVNGIKIKNLQEKFIFISKEILDDESPKSIEVINIVEEENEEEYLEKEFLNKIKVFKNFFSVKNEMEWILKRISAHEKFDEFKNVGLNLGVTFGKIGSGIVGHTKLLYDIFGNLVNLSSRLSDVEMDNEVIVHDENIKECLDEKTFSLESKGKVDLKGFGKINVSYVRLK